MRETETRSRPLARTLRRKLIDAETILWSRLRAGHLHGWRFRRQHPVGRYIADFACVKARLIVEVDGATHSTPRERLRDASRTGYLESQGWQVLRFWNTDIYENLQGVMDAIHAALPPSALTGHSPRKRGEKKVDRPEGPL
jgi:very-short-patch-repair endonuclease